MGRKQKLRRERRRNNNNNSNAKNNNSNTINACCGCSFYCYCSEDCHTTHWKDKHNHRAECKQLNILDKYHKPYTKEIRDAVIRGDLDSEIPALEKL